MSEFLRTLIASGRDDASTGWFRFATAGSPAALASLERRSWGEVHTEARRAAAFLRERGVGRGDAVALLVAQPYEVAVAAQAVWLCGASVTMLHQPTARTDLTRYAEHTAATLDTISAVVVVLGTPFDGLAGQFGQATTRRPVTPVTIGELSGGTTLLSADAEVAEEGTVALLQLTSGSTSAPKAVQITHRNLISNITSMITAGDIRSDDVMVSWLPLFHDMGMVGFLTLPMTVGIGLVKVTPTHFLARPAFWLELISKFGGTITAAPNFAYAVVARAARRASGLDLSTMRFALNGAEPIDPSAVRAFTDATAAHGLDPGSVVCAYGMAEATLAVSFAPLGTGLQVDAIDPSALEEKRLAVPTEDGPVRRFPLLGPPLPGIEVRSVDPTGTVRGEREVGVLQIRGDAVTALYLTGGGAQPTQDTDGWLDTGDEGYLVDGNVVVCGRSKDVIIFAGRNIYPTDIERAAERVDGVRAGNSVAVRLDHTGRRETFAVAVESRSAGDAAEVARIKGDVTAQVVTELGARPALVTVLPAGSLPKTPSGKLRRADAATMVAASAAAPPPG